MIATNPSTAEEIQLQMQGVRSSLREDVKELVENARDMTDWQYYVRRYPWAAVAVAAGVGFVISPGMFAKRAEVHLPTTPSSEEPFGKASRLAESPSIVSRLASNALNAATGALSRAAMSFLSQQLSTLLASDSTTRYQAVNQGDQQHVEPHL